jgi:hypothetical protein
MKFERMKTLSMCSLVALLWMSPSHGEELRSTPSLIGKKVLERLNEKPLLDFASQTEYNAVYRLLISTELDWVLLSVLISIDEMTGI